MPDGRVSVDGFLCVYDVSMVPNRSPEKQTEYCAHILNNILKTRPQKPCVIAATKCDEANEILVRELERLVNRKGITSSYVTVYREPFIIFQYLDSQSFILKTKWFYFQILSI